MKKGRKKREKRENLSSFQELLENWRRKEEREGRGGNSFHFLIIFKKGFEELEGKKGKKKGNEKSLLPHFLL